MSAARTPHVSLHGAVEAGRQVALSAFRLAAARVPAYRDFLRQHGVDPSRIRTVDDFLTLPVTDKDSYLRAYPIEDLCLDGAFDP